MDLPGLLVFHNFEVLSRENSTHYCEPRHCGFSVDILDLFLRRVPMFDLAVT